MSELRAEICTMLQLQAPALPACTPPPEFSPDDLYSSDPAGLLRLHDLCCDSQGIHVIMEHCNHGDFFDYIARRKCIPESEAAGMFRQLVHAARHMHRRGIVHRDLKPENILVQMASSPGSADVITLKIADFGLALHLPGGQLGRGVAGSPFYMAPEVIRNRAYGEAVDVWSLGVVLFVALSGTLPFFGKNHNAIFAAVCRAEPNMTRRPWPLLSSEVRHLIGRMLCPDPAGRITLEEVMAHPWLAGNRCPIVNRRSFNAWPAEPETLWPASSNPASPVCAAIGGDPAKPGHQWLTDQGEMGVASSGAWSRPESPDPQVEIGGDARERDSGAPTGAEERAARAAGERGGGGGGVGVSVWSLLLPAAAAPDVLAPVEPTGPISTVTSSAASEGQQRGELTSPGMASAWPACDPACQSPAAIPRGTLEAWEDPRGAGEETTCTAQAHRQPARASSDAAAFPGAAGSVSPCRCEVGSASSPRQHQLGKVTAAGAPNEGASPQSSAVPVLSLAAGAGGQGCHGGCCGAVVQRDIVIGSCDEMHRTPPPSGGCSLNSAQPSNKSEGIIWSASTSCNSSSSSSSSCSSSYYSSEDAASLPSPSLSFHLSPTRYKMGREERERKPFFHFPCGL